MRVFEIQHGTIEIDRVGDIWIRQDADRVLIERSALGPFFEAIDALRDEVMPPDPLEIPDPARFDDVYERINAVRKAQFEPNEAKAAVARLNLAVGNIISPGRCS